MDKIVTELVEHYRTHPQTARIGGVKRPSKEMVAQIIDLLQKLLFPGFFDQKHLQDDMIMYYVGDILESVRYHLPKQILRAYQCTSEEEIPFEEHKKKAEEKTKLFLERIAEISRLLDTDVSAAYDGDPAAYSKDEIIYSYPGIYAIMVYRIAHELYLLEIPMIPRIMTEHAHSLTGIDIHPGASIGEYFFIDHGTGIVIGETTVIGERVKVYQGVTLGGLSTSGGQALKGVRRHPTIEDDVTIYSGASILGGNTVIGKGAVIGGNTFITKSVPPYTRVITKAFSAYSQIDDTPIGDVIEQIDRK